MARNRSWGFYAVKRFRECKIGEKVKVTWPTSINAWGYRQATVIERRPRALRVRLASGAEVTFIRCGDIFRYRWKKAKGEGE